MGSVCARVRACAVMVIVLVRFCSVAIILCNEGFFLASLWNIFLLFSL